jgi:uncharacterized phage infection (PIP) family protein YhgE
MATTHGEATPEEPAAGTPAADESKGKGHSPWLWVSIAVAVVAVGLLVWGLKTQSDLNSANDNVAQLEAQNSQQQDNGSAIVGAMKSAYGELKQQLGATNEDLQQTQDDLDQAQQSADQAQKDAAAAKQDAAQSKSETDKAKAQADEAKAQAQEAESKAAIVTDCAKAYLTAFGGLFEGGNLSDNVQTVKGDLQGITDRCQGALGGS